MKDRLITIGLVAAGVVAGFLMRGPIDKPGTGKINSHQLANWVNGSCEVKQRMVAMDVEARQKGETPFYVHCE
jgi:hypothetical protein